MWSELLESFTCASMTYLEIPDSAETLRKQKRKESLSSHNVAAVFGDFEDHAAKIGRCLKIGRLKPVCMVFRSPLNGFLSIRHKPKWMRNKFGFSGHMLILVELRFSQSYKSKDSGARLISMSNFLHTMQCHSNENRQSRLTGSCFA